MKRRSRKSTRLWLTKAETARVLGYGIEIVDQLVEQGLIGMMKIADLPPRFNAADVNALVERSMRPAIERRELVEA